MNENLTLEGWEDEEYKSFVDKFKRKKTTDDCYTPENVYNAIADWVAREYGIDPAYFVRPFWPGSDYRRETYATKAVVVDNPPFSILSEIVAFYAETGRRFFLFAPTLTLFSSSCAALPCGVKITYKNGANVNTSFLTNLEPEDVQVRTVPELYQIVKRENDRNEKAATKELPKYNYPDEVLTAAAAYRLCKYGVAFTVRRGECLRIGAMDAQRPSGKSIFGSGYLLSSHAAAERAAAERVAAENWTLSMREREMIRWLDEKNGFKPFDVADSAL